jgi:hypothetical protein
VLIAAALLAGCSTSGHGVETVTPPVSTAAPSLPSIASSPPSTAITSTASTTHRSSTHPSSSNPPAHQTERSTCRSLTIRVLPGGASAGQEIAGVQFTNTGSSSCVLVGYPTVTLFRNGQQVGQTSQPSRSTESRRTLRPGDVAESLLHDYTLNCQAPLSDSVKVVAPGSTISQLRPQFQMRGCILRADPLGPPE